MSVIGADGFQHQRFQAASWKRSATNAMSCVTPLVVPSNSAFLFARKAAIADFGDTALRWRRVWLWPRRGPEIRASEGAAA